MARYKKDLLAAFKPHFKELGFTKRDATWHLETPETIQAFNVQTSQWSESYYFNVGIYFRSLGSLKSPAENFCHIRARIPDYKFHQESIQRVKDLSNFERLEFGIEERISELKNLIYPLVFDWFHRFRNIECTKLELTGIGRPWFFVTKEVWPLVNLEMPK